MNTKIRISIYGIIISGEARVNNINYGYGRNWFYTFWALPQLPGILLTVSGCLLSTGESLLVKKRRNMLSMAASP